jgi:hypothetical protein
MCRWGILRAAIPLNISLAKTIALLHALAKRYNFCIDEEEKNGKHFCEHTVPEIPQNDEDHMMLQEEGYITMDFNEIGASCPLGLMDSGHHHDDMPRAT